MTRPGSVVVIGGGVRSGKSAFALARARGPDFETIEEPVALVERLSALRDVDAVVIDCLTLWISNLMLRDEPAARIAARVDELARVAATRPFHTIVVTNEVGMGVVPETALGRAFRDVAGLAHQRLAAVADELYLATLGVVVRLRPSPVRLAPSGAPS